ncbi:MAG TPA: SgcJ/EcaC family oxidoreductase [Trebonia sp.]|nr:SgcJ/EcaC family oxidoreductase [Trebonia sp.]
MPPATPAGVLARRRQLVLSGDIDGFADLFAPDGVIEGPFTGPPGEPVRLEGREAIRAYSRQMMASPVELSDLEVTELYQTVDPEVVIVEARTKGIVTATGQPFAVPSIQVLRIRDGQILLFRDFVDARALAAAVGEPHQGS